MRTPRENDEALNKKPFPLTASRSGLRFIMGELRKVLRLAPRAYRLVWDASPPLTFGLMLLNLIAAFFPVIILWITKLTIDRIAELVHDAARQTPQNDLSSLWVLFAALGIVWILARVLDSLSSVLTVMLRCRVEQHAQYLVMSKCNELDMAFYESSPHLDVLDNAVRSSMSSAWGLVRLLFSLVRTLLTLGTFLAALIRLSWIAMVVVAVTTTPHMLTSSYFARRRWRMVSDRAGENRLRYYITGLMTTPASVKEIRVFGLASHLLRRFQFFCSKFYREETDLERKAETATFGLGVLADVGALSLYAYTALRAIAHAITIGDVVFFTQAISNCQRNLISVFAETGQIYQETLFVGNLFAMLDVKPTEIEGALQRSPSLPRHSPEGLVPSFRRSIVFRDVSFRYPGSREWALRKVSCVITPGQTVALVGLNGAGKTTLVKLLVRLYDPTEGEILLDGHDLRECDPDSLRRLFGVIFQDYVHYWLTLRENIGFGDVVQLDDMTRILYASQRAEAHEIAERLPKQYETFLGKQFSREGVDLSGGEWQKICLARAYMRDCPILILDEPTSGLDALAEAKIFKRFDELARDKTVILISHRFSTVRMADRILVLNDGELVEDGPHGELLADGGLYARMFNTQAGPYR